MATSVNRRTLELTVQERVELERISVSRSLPAIRILRARLMLAFAKGDPVAVIAANLNTSESTVHVTVARALDRGVLPTLKDLQRPGRPNIITPEAVEWLVNLACQKPKDVGYPHELWTLDLLSKHAQRHCEAAGHPSLARIVRSTVHKLLSRHEVQPHKMQYYLENRDVDFDAKMAQVLCVYKQVALYREAGLPGDLCAVVSYDEKPGMQAIANTAPDLPPVPGKHRKHSRDHEYVRHGTVSLLAGLDLMNGSVHGIVRDRHRTAEFIELLRLLDERYPKGAKIRIVLDNHSAHTSRELQAFLEERPGRFEFVFTPKHGSWLNMVEIFFAKMANSMLRGIRADSKQEFIDRIEQYLNMVNAEPVVFRWKYKLDEVTV
jgi:transposase